MSKLIFLLLICFQTLEYQFDPTLPKDQRVATVSGALSKDDPDVRFERITVKNGKLRLSRLDNACIDSISIVNGSLELLSMRQCHVGCIQIDKCTDDIAMLVTSVFKTRGDASNNNHFGSVMIRNSESKKYLVIEGRDELGNGTARDMLFDYVFLHCPWEGSGMKNGPRTFLEMSNSRNIVFSHLNITSDPGFSEGSTISFRKNVLECDFRVRIRGPKDRPRINDEGITNEWTWIR